MNMRTEEVVAIRVPKRLKDELKELEISPSELRAQIAKLVKQKKLKGVLDEIDRFRRKIAKSSGVTAPSAESIRWDREHGH